MGLLRLHAGQQQLWETKLEKKETMRVAVFTHRLIAVGDDGKPAHVGYRARTNVGTSIEVLFEHSHLDLQSFRAEPLEDRWWT
jgi:hypothetical protein